MTLPRFLETEGSSWRPHGACIQTSVGSSRTLSTTRDSNQSRPTVVRVLILDGNAHKLLKPSGIVFAAVEHAGRSQQSPEEAEMIRELYENALTQRYVDRDGRVQAIGPENILVVAPYNMQVNRLKDALPSGARVGTVDKFQGQEAEIVLISMTTSSEAELPRNIEFLYSKNRLNVAISRAKSLAILVASPALTSIRCTTPQQMALVNTLCWVTAIGA